VSEGIGDFVIGIDAIGVTPPTPSGVDLTALADVGHYWGGDIFASPTGDLLRVTRAERSKERVLRRLLTNPGEMLFHPEYGAGIPQRVGSTTDPDEITGIIRTQMALEASVSQNPPPSITVIATANGVEASINYVVLPDQQPVSLGFSVDN
jgi:hypothetical protein